MNKKISQQSKSTTVNKQKDDTRQIAFEAICHVLGKHKSLEMAFETALFRQADPRDKAAAYRLVICVLRQKGTLDAIIEPFLKRKPPEKVIWTILIGVAQIIFLEIPFHAAINTTVNLTRQNALSGFTGLVNAVLRRVVDQFSEQGEDFLNGFDQAQLNIPSWLWQEWSQADFQPRQLAKMLDIEAPLDLSVKSQFIAPESGEFLLKNTYRFPVGTKVDQLSGYQEGQFWVQDVAASLPATLLNVQQGEKVADLCAAPGGKTAQLLLAGGDVVAVEKDTRRIKRLKENLSRLQFKAEIQCADAAKLPYEEQFDAILLDAPCSATGIFRRHPDVLHLKKAKDIDELVKIQQEIALAAVRYLKKGGRLIYSVCSLHRREAEEQAHYLSSLPTLQASPFLKTEIEFLPESLTKEGWIRTLPFMWSEKGGMDGFFIARFIKK